MIRSGVPAALRKPIALRQVGLRCSTCLKKTGGSTDGTALVSAMRGASWESPRGPMSIDRTTGDVVHNIYIRKVENVDGELRNVEFATFSNVRDPRVAAK